MVIMPALRQTNLEFLETGGTTSGQVSTSVQNAAVLAVTHRYSSHSKPVPLSFPLRVRTKIFLESLSHILV